MCKSLRVSVGSEKSRLGLEVSNRILCSSSPVDEQTILFEMSRPNRLFSEYIVRNVETQVARTHWAMKARHNGLPRALGMVGGKDEAQFTIAVWPFLGFGSALGASTNDSGVAKHKADFSKGRYSAPRHHQWGCPYLQPRVAVGAGR